MCRIAGVLDFKNSLGQKLEEVTISMRDSMVYGGPDDAGLFISQDRKVAFGNRRLSIIDLTQAGHQPMSNLNGTIWITYNGEIYNYKELRGELVSLGYVFKSNTDTEVLVHGYDAWGIDKLLPKLRGMFAFAIYDSRNKDDFKIYLARDRFGIKPLYYYKNEELILFSSEVKAFLRAGIIPDKDNHEAFIRFLQLGSVPVPLTTAKDVYSLPAAHFVELNHSEFKIKKYWDLSNLNTIPGYDNHNLIVDRISTLLKDSVNLHLNSDAPLGVFLSGGIDSSALVALASEYAKDPIATLSIVFEEEEYNEGNYAKLIAEKYKTNHTEILIHSNDFYNEVPLILSAMDQPTIDGVNSYFISKAAKKLGLKVVLSGIGADEVFLGYSHFKKIDIVNNLLKLFACTPSHLRKFVVNAVCGLRHNFKKFEFVTYPSYENAYLLFRGLFTPSQIQDLLGVSAKELNGTNKIFGLNELSCDSLFNYFNHMEFEHYLQDQILKDIDFMSMRHSVEVRVPYLDHKLVEFVNNVELNEKMKNGINKSLLVESLRERLPSQIYTRQKMGFTFPFSNWLKNNWQFFEDGCLQNSSLNKKAVKKVWKDVVSGNMHWSRGWALYVFANVFTHRKEKITI